jgi:hypothetical protein
VLRNSKIYRLSMIIDNNRTKEHLMYDYTPALRPMRVKKEWIAEIYISRYFFAASSYFHKHI